MLKTRHILLLIICFCIFYKNAAFSQEKVSEFTISGRILDSKTKEPLPFAVIAMLNHKNWAAADKDAYFNMIGISKGEHDFYIYLLGYADKLIKVNVNRNIKNLEILMDPVSLELDEVLITVKQKFRKNNASGSYSIDRTAMEHLQTTNITDVMSLLPGGKFRGDLNLTNSNANFEIRGNKTEMNSASFSTAVEVDGVRLSNNADFGKLQGIDNRSIAVSNVESVEIIAGIPSVEYGDLNSGLVKIKTSKGHTPYVVELVTKPHTKLLALRKGFIIGSGTLNASIERAKSVSNLISPFTSYVRNGATINYSQQLNPKSDRPCFLNVGLNGNIGGYNSKLDPDQIGENYVKVKDNSIRANVGLDWKPGARILNRLTWNATLFYSDKFQKENYLESNASSDVAIHTMENGYFVAEEYDTNLSAPVIILKPGHYYTLGYYDDKPIYFTTKVKADSKNSYGECVFNHVMLGAEYSYAHNRGRGEYYDNMRLAPTWREYLLYKTPAMNNLSIFLEDNLNIKTTKISQLKLTAGVRSDITMIKGSDYGSVAAFSPRLNLRYVFWEDRNHVVSNLEAHIGWGKAVKLPSFNILYPRPNYLDLAVFTTANNASNIAFSAYKTQLNQSLYNKDLKWQASNQLEVGMNTTIAGMDIGLLFYRNVIHDTYTNQTGYRPFFYNYTGPSSLEGVPIPFEDRIFEIDHNTGIVTVSDKTGKYESQTLNYTTYKRFIPDYKCVNGSPVERMGVEYFINFPKIKPINTQIRIDGNFYYYKGINQVMTQSYPGMYSSMSDGKPYKYIGYYVGPASAANGEITKQVNLNLMLTTHIPKIRLIISLRFEMTFMDYSQNLSYWSDGQRSYSLDSGSDFIGTDHDIYKGDRYVATYPLYYTTWEKPDQKIPFMEKYLWAREHDKDLFNDLYKLVQKSNYPYIFNPRTISPYYSINFNSTKEIGDIASISFYVTNFLNNMQKIYSSWDSVEESSIYDKGYIPRFYYGLSVRLKF